MKTPPLIKRLFLLPVALLGLAHAAPNLIITTDIGGDPDDEQSMRRLMLYSNEFNLMGLVASALTTSGIHPELIDEVINEYDQVRGNLALHASGYPTATYLRTLVKDGSLHRGTAYVGSGKDTEGSDFIIAQVDAATAPVNIAIWGGATDVAQAFYDVANSTTRTQAQKDAWVSKVRICSITDQDGFGTTLKWIRDNFPNAFIIENGYGSLTGQHMAFRGMYQNDSFSYVAGDTPIQLIETANVSLNQAAWVNTNVKTGHGALGTGISGASNGYPLVDQLPPTSRNTNGVKEGDTSSWFYFLPNGLGNPDQPTWGGWGGRFAFVSNLYWNDLSAADTHWSGSTNAHVRRKWTIARWRKAYQHDFAARMDWCVQSVAQANHNPVAGLNGDTSKDIVYLTAAPGSVVNLSAAGSTDPDGDSLSYKWWNYAEADTHTGTITLSNSTSASASFTLPSNSAGKTIHVILEVTDNGSPALTSYRRLVVTGGTPGGSADPIAHWKFDETSGTSAADSSGNNLTGTLTNGPVWDSAGALAFDGSNDHVNIGNPSALQLTGAMTLSAWIKVESFANSGRIVAKQGGSTARSWGLNVESSGAASFQIASNASTLLLVNSPATLQTGQWYLLTGVYEPGVSLKLYIDGTLAATNSTAIPSAQFSANGLNVNIGRRPSGDLHFNGLADDVRIYDRALSAAEVAALADTDGLTITVADTANAADWSVRSNLQVGDTQYGDRTFTLSSVPASLLGSAWIRTANDSKAFTGATLVSFTVGEDTDIYVAHNDAITTKPSWLSTWTDTGNDLVNTESTPRTFSLFRKTFAAGATVSLGNNGSTTSSGYTIILQPASSGFVVGAETILDNTASSGVTATSGWAASTGTSGYYGNNYLHDNNTNNPETVTYVPTLAGTGLRDVYVRWTAATNRATNARYIITHAGGSATVFQSQRVSGGTWVKLGTWSFDAGMSGTIVVSNDGADGYVVSDAIRFVNVATP